MYARTIQAALVPGRADEAVRVYQEQVLPMLQQQPGYVRSTMLIDREANEAMTITIWDSKEAATATVSFCCWPIRTRLPRHSCRSTH